MNRYDNIKKEVYYMDEMNLPRTYPNSTLPMPLYPLYIAGSNNVRITINAPLDGSTPNLGLKLLQHPKRKRKL
jgi:hypothetical protein